MTAISDDDCVTLFELLDDLTTARIALDVRLRAAFIQLAQYKYVSGTQTGEMAMRLPASMSPLMKWEMEESESTNLYSFSLIQQFNKSQISVTPSPVPVRRFDAATESTDAPSLETSTTPDPDKVKDPLQWFGVLVPQALRDAQAEFKRTLQQLVPLLEAHVRLSLLTETLNETKE